MSKAIPFTDERETMSPQERSIDIVEHMDEWAQRDIDRDTWYKWIHTYIQHHIATAIEMERKACAEIADDAETWVHGDSYEAQVDMRRRIAARIRKRYKDCEEAG